MHAVGTLPQSRAGARQPLRQGGPRLQARPSPRRLPAVYAAAETQQAAGQQQAEQQQHGLQPHASGGGGGAPTPAAAPRQLSGRVAVLRATKSATLDVQEQGRPLAEYMVLPASQYSVLDAQRVERLDADTFRCYVGALKLFSLQVEPVITVSVTVQERGPTVRLLNTQLRGSKAVEAANERFDATMQNVVRWQEAPAGSAPGALQLASDTVIQVQLQVPGWFFLPTSTIERSGGAVMAKVLDTAVPRFLQQLSEDYRAWAAGDETRQPVASGSLMDDVYEEGEEGCGPQQRQQQQQEEQGWD